MHVTTGFTSNGHNDTYPLGEVLKELLTEKGLKIAAPLPFPLPKVYDRHRRASLRRCLHRLGALGPRAPRCSPARRSPFRSPSPTQRAFTPRKCHFLLEGRQRGSPNASSGTRGNRCRSQAPSLQHPAPPLSFQHIQYTSLCYREERGVRGGLPGLQEKILRLTTQRRKQAAGPRANAESSLLSPPSSAPRNFRCLDGAGLRGASRRTRSLRQHSTRPRSPMGKSAGPRFESKRPTAPADHGGGVTAKPGLPISCACALSAGCLANAPKARWRRCSWEPRPWARVPPLGTRWSQCSRERRDQAAANDSYKKDS